MLVIMENRNIGALLQLLFDLKASRSSDVLEVDAAEGSGNERNGLYDLVYIMCFYTDRDCVYIAESLEERAFSFHNRHSCLRSDVAQAEYCGAVCYNCDGVPSSGQLVTFIDILLDLKTGLRNTRSVCKTQRLGTVYFSSQLDFNFTLPLIVLFQGFLCVIHLIILHI